MPRPCKNAFPPNVHPVTANIWAAKAQVGAKTLARYLAGKPTLAVSRAAIEAVLRADGRTDLIRPDAYAPQAGA